MVSGQKLHVIASVSTKKLNEIRQNNKVPNFIQIITYLFNLLMTYAIPFAVL